jgi:large subunit ribosomal protein L3
MVTTLLGKKIGMTQVWDKDGNVKPVTVIQAGPCRVVQVKTKDGKDRYNAVQLGLVDMPARNGGKGTPRLNKAMLGHFGHSEKKTKTPLVPTRHLREVRLADDAKNIPERGSTLKVGEVFNGVTVVDVIGTTKGRGFTGCMKRHKFQGGRATHGSKNHKEPGAIGQNQSGHCIIRGKRLPGHFGNVQRTTRNLEVVKIENDQDLIYVAGPVPGPRNGLVLVRKARRV